MLTSSVPAGGRRHAHQEHAVEACVGARAAQRDGVADRDQSVEPSGVELVVAHRGPAAASHSDPAAPWGPAQSTVGAVQVLPACVGPACVLLVLNQSCTVAGPPQCRWGFSSRSAG